MLRRLLILVFVIANLTSQVSVAYACAMMGPTKVVSAQCCCKTGAMVPSCAAAAGDKDCCQKVVKVSAGPTDELASVAADVKVPSFDPLPVPAAQTAEFPLVAFNAQRERDEWTEYDPDHPHGTSLYLSTQRLRL